jgi:hypothetical protein
MRLLYRSLLLLGAIALVVTGRRHAANQYARYGGAVQQWKLTYVGS